LQKINWGRLLLGGVLGGVLITAKDFVLSHNILLPIWKDLIAKGLVNAPQVWYRPIFLLEGLLEGLLLAWLYVLARPRLGPGPKTAIITGLTGGLLVRGVATVDQLLWAPYPPVMPLYTLEVGVFTAVAVSMLAGWIYKEE